MPPARCRARRLPAPVAALGAGVIGKALREDPRPERSGWAAVSDTTATVVERPVVHQRGPARPGVETPLGTWGVRGSRSGGMDGVVGARPGSTSIRLYPWGFAAAAGAAGAVVLAAAQAGSVFVTVMSASWLPGSAAGPTGSTSGTCR